MVPHNQDKARWFTIKDLERFSGVKAHTIRVWEQRYRLLSPGRSRGNIRMYSPDDVQRLLNVSLLLNIVPRISAISRLHSSELKQSVDAVSDPCLKRQKALHHLIYYMYRDIEKFEDVLDACVQCWGTDITLEHVVLPFLEKASLLSYKDKTFETHFAVTAIRRKLILAIENVQSAAISEKSAVLFLPMGEHFDLYLLYMAYVLKQKGLRVFYLGTNVSINTLQNMMETNAPDMLFTFIPQNQKFKLQDLASFLKQQYPKTVLHAVTCNDSENKKLNNVRFIFYKEIKMFDLRQYQIDRFATVDKQLSN
ncbi:MAG TPA: MerR family transcriptional regulator [Chitinophagaceae bacterium]|jgi:DNA-binding transcriptional MerR regulator|nr:MerR family transcriptional regulator [Chitinophagaceae bacterium]